ncbi:MAG TPA: hypothetical protein VFP80_17870 [Thermoanaerobaculia bacterium]|nr:hypothetical protein [Thermoanaerobaculia bacterium]
MKKLATLLLFALAIPAAARPLTIRAEKPVSEAVYSVDGNGRSDAWIATNGNQYLAVWTDLREGGQPAVYAARIQADGTILDSLGIRVAHGAFAGPVIWTGSKYLVSYQEEVGPRSYIRTVTTDGVFGEPIEVGSDVRFGSMAANGTNVLLVLPEKAMQLDPEGNRLRDVTLAKLPTTPYRVTYYHTRIAVVGSTYLVAAAVPDVIVQAVSSDGTVSAAQTLAVPARFTTVDVASDGERFLVVYPNGQLYSQVVTVAGVPEGPARRITGLGNTNYPSLEWRNGEYLLMFNDGNALSHVAVRLAADGSPVGSLKYLGQDYTPQVDIATNGRGGIALFSGELTAGVFDDSSVTGDDVFRRVVGVAVTARSQRNVRIARLGNGSVTAWDEGGGILLSAGAGTAPVVVNGNAFGLIDVLVDRSNVIWVLWQGYTSSRIGLRRFLEDLTPVDPGPIYFDAPGAFSVDAAAAGEGVIALAYGYAEAAAFSNVGALLLWETGTGIARKDVQLTGEAFADDHPTVAFDGSSFVYAWSHAKGPFPMSGNEPQPEIELAGARVTPGGALLDTTPVRIAGDIGFVEAIDSAPGANGVAFAWQSYGRPIRAALYNGTEADLGAPSANLGELAPHQGGFLLVRGTVRPAPELTDAGYVVLGPNLAVDATGSLPPWTSGRFLKPFDIDAIGGASPVFAYSRVTDDGEYGHVPRVFVRQAVETPSRRRVLR